MHRALVAILLLCGVVVASHKKKPSESWAELREKNLQLGFSVERIDCTLEACRKSKLSVQEAEALLCPVYAAQEEALSAECVLLKIEEGLVKRIAWKDVQTAAKERLERLRRADEMVLAARQGRGGQHRHLVMHVCMAMESGLPEDVLVKLLGRPGGYRYGRMIHVVEAGETLHLAGLDSGDVLHVMNDCLDRDLSGAEIARVVDLVQIGLRAGKAFDAIHDSLWIPASAVCNDR